MNLLERWGLIRPKATLPRAARLPEQQPVAFAAPMARPSWSLMSPTLANPFSRVPQPQNLHILEQLVDTIPILPAALTKIVQLVGCPKIESDDQNGVQDLMEWWDQVRVNRVQTGGENAFSSWCFDHLLYGRAHMEVILTGSLDDIYALQELHTRTVDLRPKEDGYGVDLVQFQGIGGQPTVLDPTLILTAVHDVRNDSPQGNSLLAGLPFVAEIYEKLLWSVREVFTRHGVPVFFVRYKPPETLSDPTGGKSAAIAASMSSALQDCLQSQADGKVRDFVGVGDIEVQIVGAAGETLNIEVPGRQILENIVARTGLPPMLLGLSWSTAERMSRDQAILLGEMIDHIREHLEAPIRYLFRLRQALVGRSFEFDLCWDAPSLMDLQVEAQAALLQAQADSAQLKLLEREWQLGLRSNIEVARARRPEFEGMTDAEVLRALPDLLAAPPAPPPSPFGGGNPAGGGTPAGGIDGNVTRALAYGEEWKVTNGNGHRG